MTNTRPEQQNVDKPKKKLSPILKIGAVFLLVLVMVLFSLELWSVVSNGYQSIRLYTGYKTTDGVVTADIIDGSNTLYEVEINGEIYKGESSSKIRKGEQIEIAYLDRSPKIHRPKKDLWNDTVTFGFTIAIIVIVILFIANNSLSCKRDRNET